MTKGTNMGRIFGAVFGVIAALTAITILGGSWFTVNSGYLGVLTRNGAVVGTAGPGLGFKLPLIDGITEVSTQQQLRDYNGSGSGLAVYTFDQQAAEVHLSVSYHIPADADSVTRALVNYGGEEGLVSRALDPKVYEEVKNVFGTFNAAVAIKERARLNTEIENAIRDNVKGHPIVIDSVQISNIDYSDAYEKVAEERSQAEVEVLKQKQLLEQQKVQAEITVTQAKAEAESNLARARAEAEATKVRGDAEGSAIRAKGEALKDNPALVALIQAEKWNGQLPTTMIPGATVPFMDVNPAKTP